MARKKAKLSYTAPHGGRRSLKAPKGRAAKAHLFGADLNQYNELDLQNLAKTARLVLCDVGLHQAGAISWDYKGMTPAAAQQQMEAVLTMVDAEEKRRAGEKQQAAALILELPNGDGTDADDEHIQRLEDLPALWPPGVPVADDDDEDIGRGSR